LAKNYNFLSFFSTLFWLREGGFNPLIPPGCALGRGMMPPFEDLNDESHFIAFWLSTIVLYLTK